MQFKDGEAYILHFSTEILTVDNPLFFTFFLNDTFSNICDMNIFTDLRNIHLCSLNI